MKKGFFAGILAIVISGVFVAEALAQANPNTLVNQRKSAMALQGKYFGPILGMVTGRAPYDAAIVQRNADYLTVITKLAWDDFQPATAGAERTQAKDDIYKDLPKFKATADAMQAEVQKLVVAARAGDQAAVGVAARSVARSCNGCHEDNSNFKFRFRIE